MHGIDSVTDSSLVTERADVGTPRENATEETSDPRTFEFRPLSIGISESGGRSTSPVSTCRKASEVVSPRPERPTSSESRKRFTKILDIDRTPVSDVRGKTRLSTCDVASRPGPVDEMSSHTKSPAGQQTDIVSNGQSNKDDSYRLPESYPRWSGVTSMGTSTVDSILEKHIECLGLRPEQESQSQCSASSHCENRDHDVMEPQPKMVANEDSVLQSNISSGSMPSSMHRPTSLSSATQKKLMPPRLFAGLKTPNLVLATTDSQAQSLLTWTDTRARPSYGWLSLQSSSRLNVDIAVNRQTLLSGEYADIESLTNTNFVKRRHSSPHLRLLPSVNDLTVTPPGGVDGVPSCHRWNSDRVSRQTSKRRRKLKVHLKTPARRLSTPTSDEWTSTDEHIQDGESHLHHLGMTGVRFSTVDGFAELSGDSALMSHRSLNSVCNRLEKKPSESWSKIVSAMPVPPQRGVALKKAASISTIESQRLRPSIVDPVNNSRLSSQRQSHEIRACSSVPRLARLDLGPSMRVSQFDLIAECRARSPTRKPSSFAEPLGLLEGSPSKHKCLREKRHRRQRFHSLRQMMPVSMRGFASLAPANDALGHPVIVSRSCSARSPAADFQETLFPETVAMSDFTYRKHKLLEKFRKWYNRCCLGRRRRFAPQEGILV